MGEMTFSRIVLLGLAALLPACQNFPGLQKSSVPETSRTAIVRDVRINLSEVAPAELKVNVGDEVRFINDRTQPVRLILIEAGKSIACNRGFTGMIDQEADIAPGGYASFCFDKAGLVKYMVRSQAAVPGGEQVLSAQIQVQGGGATPVSARQSSLSTGRSEAELKLTPQMQKQEQETETR